MVQQATDLHNKAVKLAEAGRWENAFELFAKAVEADPTMWSSWSDGSVALERSGNLEQAARWLDHLVRTAPDTAGYRIRLSSVLYHQGEYESASAEALCALAAYPGEASWGKQAVAAHGALTLALRDAGNTGAARGVAKRIELATECQTRLAEIAAKI
eukprot:TRINITY_DN9633_c0_g3_i1.p1 TRINITY_DN9633_c0_g3~~TRINITY_DN9633_c0_g3_i1.p1  ORF type:complete len:158 (-),score=33.81 TRINITY_DN9633_c0_g3_i1:70-543(-)